MSSPFTNFTYSVGRNNYRYFYCFLLWTFIGTLYLSVAGGTVFIIKEDYSYSSRIYIGENVRVDAEVLKSPLAGRSRVVGGLRKRQPYTPTGDRRLLYNISTVSNELPDIDYEFSWKRRGLMSLSAIFDPLQRFLTTTSSLEAINILLNADMQLLVGIITSSALTVAVGFLLIFHTILIRSGQTTIEYYESWSIRIKLQRDGRVYKNQYDRGLTKNVEAVLGKGPWYTTILPKIRSPSDDMERSVHGISDSVI